MELKTFIRDLLRTGRRRYSSTVDQWLQNLADTGRGRKQLMSMSVDAGVSIAALWIAYALRLPELLHEAQATWPLFVLVPAATVVGFGALGIYRWVVRSSNLRLYRQLIKGSILSALFLVLLTHLFWPPDRPNPRSLFVIYGALLVIGTCGLRVIWQGLFDTGRRGEPIAIYGAGAAGRQLASLLSKGAEYRPVAFVDDDPAVFGSTISGLPVLDGQSEELLTELRRREAARLVLAMPSVGNDIYRRKVDELKGLGLAVQTMPSVSEIVSGGVNFDDIRDVSIRDILGRVEVVPDPKLLGGRVTERTVLVTGGGGSIGSELCRQIALLGPERLIVVDQCEENLYHITEELDDGSIDFLPRLGSVLNRAFIDRLMKENAIDTVYHAAAYKHVPIVERQPEQGVDTNLFGTLNVLDSAIEHGVSDFMLISTDKAVRPTNAMGASKRAAELVLQAKASVQNRTRISMVRFGNVLGSSGSVVPKFRKQIEAGGPVTVTHPEITRYFMTIPEAAQLVLQASAVADGGDVFVLDMGEPVKIVDLARSMVNLSGRRLSMETGQESDISIEFSGLRPGEKMYEELFITDAHRETGIPKVFTAQEVWLPWDELQPRLASLHEAIAECDRRRIQRELMALAYAGHRKRLADKPEDFTYA